MFRKTFICVAGVIAGVSAGAYSSGFFNEENMVTKTYHQTMDRLGVGSQKNESMSGDMVKKDMETGSLVSAGLAVPDADLNSQAMTKSGSASSIMDASETEAEKMLMAMNSVSKTPTTKTLGMKESTVGSIDAMEADSEAIATLAREAEAALKEAMMKKAEMERRQAELTRKVAETKKMEAAKALMEAEQARREAEEARLQAENEQAQKIVEARFTKEVYESSTGETLNYRKLAPIKSDKDKLLPLVLFLHGKGERGNDNEAQLKHGLKLFAADEGMKRFPAMVIAPQCPADQFWAMTLDQKDTTPKMNAQPTPAMRLVIELLDSMLLTESVDPDRVYVTGLSMGGFGTFDVIARRPTLFAAAAPLCGGGDPSPSKIRRLLRMPMWVIHGTEDEVININRSREMVYALESAGASPRYSELKGFGHNIWDATFNDIELYNWMFSQSKATAVNRRTKQSQARNRTAVRTKRPAGTTGLKPIGRTTPTVAPRKTVSPQPAAKTSPQPTALDPRSKPLLGQWKVMAASSKGQQANKQALERMSVTFEEDQFVIQMGDRQEVAKFKLGASEKRQEINIISNLEGVKESAGIYELNGDKLIICWGEPGRPRPTRFVNFMNVKSLVLKKQ